MDVMTDTFQKRLQETLDAVWGRGQTLTWSEPMPIAIPPLNAKQTDLLLAGMNLLNWNRDRFNAFLQEKMAIAELEALPASQIDTLLDQLNEAIADWQENRVERGTGAEADFLSSLSCKYWLARLALYPQAVQAPKKRKKRKNWILDGYQPPEYKVRIPPKPEEKPAHEPEPEPPYDWRFCDYPDENYW